jgi:aryl-alcohol dehydrogenase-like predicted oxidoreductase
MRRVPFGNTGLSVSRLGIGTDIRDANNWFSVEREIEVLIRAWELGVNLIDTDRWYRTYPCILGALPHMKRSELVLSTKTYEKTAEGAMNDVCYALDALELDYVDVFLLHAVDSREQYDGLADALEGLQEAKARGWIRHIGLSTHTVNMMQVVSSLPEIEVVLVALNMAGKSMRKSGTREEMERAVERAHSAGQGIFVMKPFARGRLFDDENKDEALAPHEVEQGLAYLYGLPFIHSTVPGMRTVEQVEQNVAVVERVDQLALAQQPES